MAKPCRVAGCPHLRPCPVKAHSTKAWGPSAGQGNRIRSRTLRAHVLREEPQCRRCGAPSVVADHVVPLCDGGPDIRENLQGLCTPCSRAKSGQEGQRAMRRSAS